MVANLTCLKRVPFLFMPGAASRKKASRHLHKHLGERFALFGAGQGWDGEPYCRGRVDDDRQADMIRDSWVSVNWGQFDRIGMYRSDRPPIGPACGVPHITNYQPGYEHIYSDVPSRCWGVSCRLLRLDPNNLHSDKLFANHRTQRTPRRSRLRARDRHFAGDGLALQRPGYRQRRRQRAAATRPDIGVAVLFFVLSGFLISRAPR